MNCFLPCVVFVEDFVQRTIPPRPLKPSLGVHWLAVNGVQPSIPQNPSIVEATSGIIPPTLPKELQVISFSLLQHGFDVTHITTCSHYTRELLVF